MRTPTRRELLAEISTRPWAMLEGHLFAWLDLAQATLSRVGENVEVAAAIDDRVTAVRRVGSSGVIQVTGTLEPRAGSVWEYYGYTTSYERLVERVRAAAADPAIQQIVLDINSPGGDVLGMTECADAIRAVREQKPVLAVCNPVAASAAYCLAAACSKIYAPPSALIGSIGVYSVHMEWSEALAAEGIKATVLRSTEAKAEGTPFEPLTDAARAAMQDRVDSAADAFIRSVAKGRGKTPAAVREGFGKGRAVLASAALDAGMIDRIGSLDDVLIGKAPKQGSTLHADDGDDPHKEAAEATERVCALLIQATGGTR